MLRSTRMLAVALVGLVAVGTMIQADALGRSPVKQYVKSLKGTFAIYTANVKGHGRVKGANPVDLDSDSPLRPLLGNGANALITHLDGCRATSFRELNNHIRRTTVRWIDLPTGKARKGTINIPR